MCGITAILGNFEYSLIINSLKQLQNRGYDSAGLSILDKNKYIFHKEINKESIDLLKEKYLDNHKFNNIIAHTRWATHGVISKNNCHPHISNNLEISLVHNGIIENYLELKNFLVNKNYIFTSETDTEVIVNLIEYYNINSNSFDDAINNALCKCNGTWGLVIQYIKEPDILYVVKKGSPLLIGKTEKYSIITSEISGFNNLINNYHELDSNKLYKINNNYNNLINYNLCIKSIELNSKDNYEHYMIKEINQQKNIIQNITCNGSRIKNNNIIFGGIDKYKNKILECDNLVLLGCGTSYHSCLYSMYHIKKMCKFKHIVAIDACNYEEYLIPNGKNCYVFVSQSGETKDLYKILEGKKKDITIGIINVVDSLIARNVTCGIYLNIGKETSVASTKAFLGQSLVLVLLGLSLMNNNKILLDNYLCDLRKLEEIIEIELNKEIIIEKINNGFILANSTLLPIAMEAALKFKEITYSHIEALSTNSLKHGPLALVTDDNFINIILGDNESVKQEILARDGKIINIILNYENLFNDLLYIIHLQRYNYILSIEKGIDPDYPRNLAKVVTV